MSIDRLLHYRVVSDVWTTLSHCFIIFPFLLVRHFSERSEHRFAFVLRKPMLIFCVRKLMLSFIDASLVVNNRESIITNCEDDILPRWLLWRHEIWSSTNEASFPAEFLIRYRLPKHISVNRLEWLSWWRKICFYFDTTHQLRTRALSVGVSGPVFERFNTIRLLRFVSVNKQMCSVFWCGAQALRFLQVVD